MPAALRHLRLRAGVRVCTRSSGSLQVGAHPDHRLVVADTPAARHVLGLLRHGADPERLQPDERVLVDRLDRAGLLLPSDDEVVRSRLRQAARVLVDAPEPVRSQAVRMLAVAGLEPARSERAATVRLLVAVGAEASRERVDRMVQHDQPHLLVTALAGRVQVGPCVVPGLTACLRCVDEHLTDRDPRHPLVVEQHRSPDLHDIPAAAQLQLALAWAVADLVALVEGDRPATWSAGVELRPDGPLAVRWDRHPRCGCAWADLLTG